MRLSILIPTYNRCKDLHHNLQLLEKYILASNCKNQVNIIISNNASTDDTRSIVQEYQKQCKIEIVFLDDHEKNIGLEANALYALKKAMADYVMYLGDDDYLEEDYIARVLQQLEEHSSLGCIIPNDYWCLPDGTVIGEREKREPKYWKAGFEACLNNAHLGHQLSGLVLKRDGLYEAYINQGVHNIYPFIFFVAYIALHNDVYYMADSHVHVTQVPQSQKDWGYGDDGLVNDIFENFKHLGVTQKQRAILESHFLKVDQRYFWATKDTNLCIEKILSGKNVSYLGRYYIAKQILHEQCYTGKRLRFMFYVLARIELLRKFLTGKPIQL